VQLLAKLFRQKPESLNIQTPQALACGLLVPSIISILADKHYCFSSLPVRLRLVSERELSIRAGTVD
jgi:hypothetical protein